MYQALPQSEMIQTQRDHMPPAFVLLEYLQGQWMAHCVQVAATLGLAEILKDGPRSVQELAQATNTHPPSLYRLLRGLASLGIFAETASNVFAQTELSEALRSDKPGSIGYLAKMSGQEWQLKAWEHLEYSIRTGKAAVEHVYGMDIWQYFHTHPAQGQLFNQAMTGRSELLNAPLAHAYDFSSFGTLVDIGGGQGSFLTTLLSCYPSLQGVLFDQPAVIESARHCLEPALRNRLRLVAGSFFTALPEGGDAYILKAVLHDWPDEDCIKILKNCRQVIKPEGKLLIVDPVIPSGGKEAVRAKLLDLLMLINCAGRERIAEEFASLFEASGFKLTQVVSTPTHFSIVEGVPV